MLCAARCLASLAGETKPKPSMNQSIILVVKHGVTRAGVLAALRLAFQAPCVGSISPAAALYLGPCTLSTVHQLSRNPIPFLPIVAPCRLLSSLHLFDGSAAYSRSSLPQASVHSAGRMKCTKMRHSNKPFIPYTGHLLPHVT